MDLTVQTANAGLSHLDDLIGKVALIFPLKILGGTSVAGLWQEQFS
jgi:hypothetical protein